MFDRSTIMKAAWEKWIAYYRGRAIAAEIDRLKFNSLCVDIAQHRRALETKLASIVG